MKFFRTIVYVGLGISLVLSVSAVYAFLALVLIDLGIRRMRKEVQWEWRWTILDALIGSYFLWGVISTTFNSPTQILYSVKCQNNMLLFFVFSHLIQREDLKSTIVGFCSASVFSGFWGLIQSKTGIVFNPDGNYFTTPEYFLSWPKGLVRELASRAGRAVGSRNHPLTYAESLIPGFFIFVYLVQRFRPGPGVSWKKPLVVWGGNLLVVLGIIASQSRGVWVGLLISIFYLCIFYWKEIPKIHLIVVILLSVGITSASPQLRGRALSIVSQTRGTANDQASKLSRFVIWLGAEKQIEKSLTLGHGIKGANQKLLNNFQVEQHYEAHNVFIQSALERGIIGLLLLLSILVIAFVKIRQSLWTTKYLFMAGLIAFIICGLTESWMNDSEVALIFWASLGCIRFLNEPEFIKKTI